MTENKRRGRVKQKQESERGGKDECKEGRKKENERD